MHHTTTIAITDAADTVHAYLGGSASNIPIIEFGDGSASITVNSRLLSPAEQVLWLRGLAADALTLAAQVEQAAAVPA